MSVRQLKYYIVINGDSAPYSWYLERKVGGNNSVYKVPGATGTAETVAEAMFAAAAAARLDIVEQRRTLIERRELILEVDLDTKPTDDELLLSAKIR